MSQSIKRIVPWGLAAVLVVSVASNSLAQSGGYRFARDMEDLVELTESVRTKSAARLQFRDLRRTAPMDARVPYAYALLLLDQKRYQDASDPLRCALDLDGKDLTAWKTRIWLSVLIQDYDDALATMEHLGTKMPSPHVSAERRQKCCEFAGFMGQILGYLAGPGKEGLDPVKQTACQQAVTSCLTPAQQEVFDSLFASVLDDYTARIEEIEKLVQDARQGEAKCRNLQLVSLSEDRAHTWRELGRLEDLRAHRATLAANERMVQAAARERAAGAFLNVDDTRYADSQEVGPFVRPNPQNMGWDPDANAGAGGFVIDRNSRPQLDHLADRYQALDQHGAAGGGYARERGLGDAHYADVTAREEKYHDYLCARERKMNQRHRRIAQDASRLLRRPIVGSTAELTCRKRVAEALITYVPIPVSPREEVERIIASYRDR